MKNKNYLILLFLFVTSLTKAQTFSRLSGGIIPDGTGDHYYDTILVSGLSATTTDSLFGLEMICFNIAHTWNADLSINLIAPDGTSINLVSNYGGDSDSFTNTCINGNSPISISTGWGPFTGTYRSSQPIGNLNNGQNPNGIWILDIVDGFGADQGILRDWNITFSNHPARPIIFNSSNLPLFLINTLGGNIVDNFKINAQLKIINNAVGVRNHVADPAQITSNIGIEIRGSSSAGFPQKGYGLSTWDISNNDTNISLLGFPEESDWILYNPYNDKSLLRNVLVYKLSNDMHQYATRTKFCEVYINGLYEGVYVFMEKIKRDKNRVDISKLKLTDNAGDSLTGGYIVKIDRSGGGADFWDSQYKSCLDSTLTTNNFPFVYHYPKIDNITPTQAFYIKTYVDSLENALAGPNFMDTNYGYRKWLDIPSMIDFTIINEVSKNVDAYLLSTYFHKDRIDQDGGKLKAGPVWDFNLSMGNADYRYGAYTTGWEWDINCETFVQPFWWGRLWEDSAYQQKLKCRYTNLRQVILADSSIEKFIDSNVVLLDEAKERHFERFPILGVYTWPNAYYPPTFVEEIDTLKNWLNARLSWMDLMLYDSVCLIQPVDTADTTAIHELQINPSAIHLFPNPCSNILNIQIENTSNNTLNSISITDLYGHTVHQEKYNIHPKFIQMAIKLEDLQLPSGFYFCKLEMDNQSIIKTFILNK